MHGHNKAFEGDPFAYVKRYAINHLAMKVHGEKDAYDFDEPLKFDERGRPIAGAYSAYNNRVNRDKGAIEAAGEGYFDLEPVSMTGRTMVYLRFVVPGVYAPAVEYGGAARGADPPLNAYWLGYLMPGLQGAGKTKIPFVDLPKTGPTHKLMLTGAMNGCSMVVTLHPGDPTKLRVYHDSFHGKDTFADDVVIARIDYSDEGYASANKKAPLLRAPVAPVVRARRASLGAAPLTAVAAPMECVRTSYGDLEQYRSVESGGGSTVSHTDVKVRTSFNFLYYDDGVSKWVAVSQPLETQPAVAQPAKAWYEREADFEARQKAHRRRGVQVAAPPSSPPWRAVIPY